MIRISLSLLVLATFLSPSAGLAADVFLDPNSFAGVVIQGEIVKGDYEKFLRALALHQSQSKEYRHWDLALNSPGGDVVEGIKIGRFVRDTMMSVVVDRSFVWNSSGEWETATKQVPVMVPRGGTRTPINDRFIQAEGIVEWVPDPSGRTRETPLYNAICYSACSLIWMASVNVYSHTRDESIGIHRPRYEEQMFAGLSIADAEKAYEALDARVRKYLYEMGMPTFVVDEVFAIPSNEMKILSAEQAEIVGAMPPHIDEWLKAKCPYPLSPGEKKDLEARSGSEGYLNYLKDRESSYYTCLESAYQEARESSSSFELLQSYSRSR